MSLGVRRTFQRLASLPRSLGTIFSSRCQTTRAWRTSRGRDVSQDADLIFGRAGWLILGRIVRRLADGIAAGGARRDRTDDLLLAKQALSQLSYGPAPVDTRLRHSASKTRADALSASAGNLRVRRLACEPKRSWPRRLVGLGRFELPTSRLSSARSNQLSYRPKEHTLAPRCLKDGGQSMPQRPWE